MKIKRDAVHAQRVSAILFALSLAFSSLYTLVIYRSRFQSDAATTGMIALEQIRTGQILLTDWVYSQDFWPMFVFNSVTVLNPLLGDVVLASQIGVLLQSFLLCAAVWLVARRFSSKAASLLILCYLLAHPSALWIEWLFGQGQYGNVTLFIATGCWLTIAAIEARTRRNLALLLGLLAAVNGYINSTSIRYVVLFSGAAIVATLFVGLTAPNRRRYWLVGAVLTASSIAGLLVFQFLTRNYTFFAGVNGSQLVGYKVVLNHNLPKLIEGLLNLASTALPGTAITSRDGFIFVLTFVLGCLAIGSPAVIALRAIKGKISPSHSWLSAFYLVMGCASLAIITATSAAENELAAARFMIPTVFVGIILLGRPISRALNRRSIATLLIGAIAVVVATSSYKTYKSIGATSAHQRLAGFLRLNGLNNGYASYWNADVLTTLSNYELRVFHVDLSSGEPWMFMSAKQFYCDQPGQFVIIGPGENQSPPFKGEEISRTQFEAFTIIRYRNALQFDLCRPQ